MMKKYEVFISSTYRDLRKERKIVQKALLDIDCFPAGMELFPATDQKQFDYIKKVISECDYYILIMGGKLGSVSPDTEKSYTQMEYEYAKEMHIPIIVFVKVDKKGKPVNYEKKRKYKDYNRFLSEAQNERLRKGFRKKHELFGYVKSSLREEIKEHPQVGWVKEIKPDICNDGGLLLQGRLWCKYLFDEGIYSYRDKNYHIGKISDDLPDVSIKYGIGTQDAFDLIFIYNEDMSENLFNHVDPEFFDDEGRLIKNCKLQVSFATMGNISEPLLFFSVGNGLTEVITKIYRINRTGITQIGKVCGQSNMYVDYSLCVPYGSQGLFDSYVYLDGNIYKVDSAIEV